MTDVPTTHAVILAAGGSTRMGQPKALLLTPDEFPGTTLLDAHLHAFAPFCHRILVVVGAHANAIRASLQPPIEVVTNPDWDQTHMSDSLQLALERLPASDWTFVTPVDVPPCRPSWLRALQSAGAPAVLTHMEQRGHPVLAPIGPTHQALRHGTLAQALQSARKVEVPDIECTLNLNAPPDWKKWLETFTVDR